MPFVTFNVEYLLEGLNKLAELPALKEKLDKVRDFKLSFEWFFDLFDLIKAAIISVQKLTIEAKAIGQGNGAIKKKAVKDWLDKVIELPFLFDKILDVDGKILDMVIDFLANLIKKTPEELLNE